MAPLAVIRDRFIRSTIECDSAIGDNEDSVEILEDFQIVRHHYRALLQFRDLTLEGKAVAQIQHRGGFIEHNGSRLHGQDGSERNHLLLTARKRVAFTVRKMIDVQLCQSLVYTLLPFGFWKLQILQAECDVL